MCTYNTSTLFYYRFEVLQADIVKANHQYYHLRFAQYSVDFFWQNRIFVDNQSQLCYDSQLLSQYQVFGVLLLHSAVSEMHV
jgi:hypothetical protein